MFAESGRRDVNDSGNTDERVGEIALDEILDDDDIDFVTVLGVGLPQRIRLSWTHDSNEVLNIRYGGIWLVSSPSNAVSLFQKAHQYVCTGVAGQPSELVRTSTDQYQLQGAMVCGPTVPTKTSSEDIGFESIRVQV